MNQEANNVKSAMEQISKEPKKNRPSFPPGKSPNPAGRTPNFHGIDKILREQLCRRNETGSTQLELIVHHLVHSALAGDITACAMIVQIAYLSTHPI